MRNACGSYVGLAANLSKPGPSRMRDKGVGASDCRAFAITITHSEESKREIERESKRKWFSKRNKCHKKNGMNSNCNG